MSLRPPPGFSEEEVLKLTKKIRHLFKKVKRPLITIRCADLLDDEWFPTCKRFDEVRALDPEKHWWMVSDDDVERYSCSVGFMDAEAYRFYFPRFLTHTLENWPDHRHNIFEVPFYKMELLEEFTIEELKLAMSVFEKFDEAGVDEMKGGYNWGQLWDTHYLRIQRIEQEARMQGKA